MWKEIGAKGLKHRGFSHWVYDDRDILFTGVELEGPPDTETELALREIELSKYAYRKHIGPYSLLSKVHAEMHRELKSLGIEFRYPSIEKYGHFTEDESKLETDVFIAIK